MRHSISHSLDVDAARQLVERAFAHYQARHPSYKPTLTWLSPQRGEIRIRVRGHELLAHLELLFGEVVVEMDVPLLFRPFQGTARRVIDREVERWLTSA